MSPYELSMLYNTIYCYKYFPEFTMTLLRYPISLASCAIVGSRLDCKKSTHVGTRCLAWGAVVWMGGSVFTSFVTKKATVTPV